MKKNEIVNYLGCEFIIVAIDKSAQKVTLQNRKRVLRQKNKVVDSHKIYPLDNSFVRGYRG